MAKNKITGEARWEAYFSFVCAFLCFGVAVVKNKFDLLELIRDGAFISGLIFGCLFYLSDLRYRLRKEVRSD